MALGFVLYVHLIPSASGNPLHLPPRLRCPKKAAGDHSDPRQDIALPQRAEVFGDEFHQLTSDIAPFRCVLESAFGVGYLPVGPGGWNGLAIPPTPPYLDSARRTR